MREFSLLLHLNSIKSRLTKQPTFRNPSTTGFLARHYPDLGSAYDWLNQISHAARPIRSPTQIWVVTRHQYGISALVSQTSFRRGNQWWRRKIPAVFSDYINSESHQDCKTTI